LEIPAKAVVHLSKGDSTHDQRPSVDGSALQEIPAAQSLRTDLPPRIRISNVARKKLFERKMKNGSRNKSKAHFY
jgi:hypothetical protein